MRLTIEKLQERERQSRQIVVRHERKLPCERCGGGPGQLVRPCTCKLTSPADASGKLEAAR